MERKYLREKTPTLHEALLKVGIKNAKEYIQKLYRSGLSCPAIAEKFFKKFQISVTPRGIEYYIPAEMKRSKAEAKRLAIKTGRMVYRKKPEHEKYKRKYISAGLRMKVLDRDNFKCRFCGNGREDGYSLEIHHKDFNPENNELENLAVACFLCRRGLHENARSENSTTGMTTEGSQEGEKGSR